MKFLFPSSCKSNHLFLLNYCILQDVLHRVGVQTFLHYPHNFLPFEAEYNYLDNLFLSNFIILSFMEHAIMDLQTLGIYIFLKNIMNVLNRIFPGNILFKFWLLN